MSRNLANNDPDRQAGIFVRLVERMGAAGAQAAAITSMGGHFCVKQLEAISPLPILNAIPEVDVAIARRKLKRIGIIGTRTVMESRLYGGISSAEVVIPEEEALERVHSAYVEMAIPGRVTDQQRRILHAVGRQLCRERGAEAIMLGGTDLFLAFVGEDPGFALVDCADIHVEAIYRRSSGAAALDTVTGR
jgi:aspartate racemase